jgi:hypothetical protein
VSYCGHPQLFSVSTLKRERLERAEELVKRYHGAEAWDKLLEMYPSLKILHDERISMIGFVFNMMPSL